MPAAAVIPAPIAYIKVAAVKKLVVGSRVQACGPPRGGQIGRAHHRTPDNVLGPKASSG